MSDVVAWLLVRQQVESRVANRVSGAGEAAELYGKAAARIQKAEAALKFIQDLAEEELPHAKVGTGAEVALRHIARRAREILAK